MSNKVRLHGGPYDRLTLQCIENLEHRIYVGGELYYPAGERDNGWIIYEWAHIKSLNGAVKIGEV